MNPQPLWNYIYVAGILHRGLSDPSRCVTSITLFIVDSVTYLILRRMLGYIDD